MNELVTERLILRAWQESDAQRLYELAKDPQIGPAAGFPAHTSVEHSLEVIRSVLSLEGNYAVVLRKNGGVIGSVGIRTPKDELLAICENSMEIGYWCGVPYWGNGYIPEAVTRLIRYGFEELKLDMLWCGYYDGNEKSLRAQQKCGFVAHHTEERAYCAMLDEYRTEHFTCLMKPAKEH